MKKLKRIFRKSIIKMHHHFPTVLQMLALEIEKAQGIGWQAENIRHEVLTAFRFLPKSRRDSPVCFDIGANIGLYTSAILNVAPNAQVNAFEPHPFSSRIMQDQFSSFDNVNIHSFAMGEKIDQKSLYFNEPGSPLSSLYLRKNIPNQIMFDQTIQVEVSTIDTEVNKHLQVPDFIKIDAEGSELEILKGGKETIEKYFPVIQFEFGGTSIDSRNFFLDYWNFFRDFNYSIYRIHPLGCEKITNYSEQQERFVCMNFIACLT